MSKNSSKYRNLSFYNVKYKQKTRKQKVSGSGLSFNYPNKIAAKSIHMKKNIKNIKGKENIILNDTKSRNPQYKIFRTSDTLQMQATNDSSQQKAPTEIKKIKRVKKKKSSSSNSPSKHKSKKTSVEYPLKQQNKASSRTDSTLGKGPLYSTFYQKNLKGNSSNMIKEPVLITQSKKKTCKNSHRGNSIGEANSKTRGLTRRKNSIKNASKKI